MSEEFEPFVFEGFVSLNESSTPKLIKIVRDTGCGRSVILEGTLPFNEDSSAGVALIQGIGMEIINVPLHQIHLKTDLVSGPVKIGVRPELPVKGVSMLLGNDLAGGKVFPDPIVTDKPCLQEDDQEKEIFPVCAVTRAMSRKASIETSEDNNNQIDDFGYNLEDTFVSQLIENGDKLPSLGDNKSPKQFRAKTRQGNCKRPLKS